MRPAIALAILLASGTAVADPAVGDADDVTGVEAAGYVAFTFDDGPNPGTTEHVIDALVQYDVPGTFFVVGKITGAHNKKKSDAAKALIAREAKLGFLVGNHTWGHAHLTTLDDKQLAFQLDADSKMIAAVTGAPPYLFRPPYRGLSDREDKAIESRHMTQVLWDIDPRDWEQPRPEDLRKRVVTTILKKNGGVVVMHDTKKLTARLLGKILDDLEAANCTRLASGKPIIVPVSIHYFLRDNGKRRTIPNDVIVRTSRYIIGMPIRCQARKAAHK